MIALESVQQIVSRYDPEAISVGVIGSHSALDIMDGAKDENMKTFLFCQQGREKTYLKFKRLVDEIVILPRFADIMNEENQKRLIESNVIFIPHRSFTTYLSFDAIENEFLVPLFGNRALLRSEERDAPRNQYFLLEQAGIKFPKIFGRAEEIDRPVMVKVPEAKRAIERAFFVATSFSEYVKRSTQRINAGIIRKEDLDRATIEEFLVGTYFNFNYFYSPLEDNLEFLGIDRRLQTNVNDFTSLPAKTQLEMDIELQNVEVGHTPATIRESLLEKVFEIGERFVAAVKREYPPGPIGPFALQSVVTLDLEICVYDVSPRVPGSPILTTTSPYSRYYHGKTIGTGRRIAMEIKRAAEQSRLGEIIT